MQRTSDIALTEQGHVAGSDGAGEGPPGLRRSAKRGKTAERRGSAQERKGPALQPQLRSLRNSVVAAAQKQFSLLRLATEMRGEEAGQEQSADLLEVQHLTASPLQTTQENASAACLCPRS
jgi:hypothetical protein